MASYCSKCGKGLDDGTRFCPSCGFDTAGGQSTCSNQQNNNYAPGYQGGDYVGPYKKKSEGIAIILSFLIPGLGHLYVGKIGLGIALLILSIVCISLGFILIIPFIGYIVIWIYGMYSSYTDAKEYNSVLVRTGQPPW